MYLHINAHLRLYLRVNLRAYLRASLRVGLRIHPCYLMYVYVIINGLWQTAVHSPSALLLTNILSNFCLQITNRLSTMASQLGLSSSSSPSSTQRYMWSQISQNAISSMVSILPNESQLPSVSKSTPSSQRYLPGFPSQAFSITLDKSQQVTSSINAVVSSSLAHPPKPSQSSSLDPPMPMQVIISQEIRKSVQGVLSQEQKDRAIINKKLALDTLKVKHPKKARAALNREKAFELRREKKYQRERSARNR